MTGQEDNLFVSKLALSDVLVGRNPAALGRGLIRDRNVSTTLIQAGLEFRLG